MNTIVFPESVVGKESSGAYVRAAEARARITELETATDSAYRCHVCDALRDRCELTKRITELEQQLADMTALYHSNTRCECGDDEACQYVRRIQELELKLSLYQGGVEVEGVARSRGTSYAGMDCYVEVQLPMEYAGQRVRVLVIKEVE